MSSPKISSYNSNSSRREFIRLMGLAGLGAVAGGLHACNPDKKADTLRFYGTGTLDINDWSQLRKDLNINLLFTDNGNDVGPVLTQMIAGNAANDYDLGGLQGGAEQELAEAGKILPWDLTKIPNWAFVWDTVKDIPYTRVNGKQYGLPIVVNADSIIYLPELTKAAGVPVVDSYAYVFDKRFKGKASMEDAWINSVIFTAIYLKESGGHENQSIDNPGDLTETELHSVMDFLVQKKKEGQFVKFWQGWEDGLKLVTSKEVAVMTGWEPIVYEAKKQGYAVEYAIPKEGYECWSNDLILHAGVAEKGLTDKAHEFANWELSGYYGCVLSQERGYVVPDSSNVEYALKNPDMLIGKDKIDVQKQRDILTHVENKFPKKTGKFYWQNVRPKNYKLYEQLWSNLNNV